MPFKNHAEREKQRKIWSSDVLNRTLFDWNLIPIIHSSTFLQNVRFFHFSVTAHSRLKIKKFDQKIFGWNSPHSNTLIYYDAWSLWNALHCGESIWPTFNIAYFQAFVRSAFDISHVLCFSLFFRMIHKYTRCMSMDNFHENFEWKQSQVWQCIYQHLIQDLTSTNFEYIILIKKMHLKNALLQIWISMTIAKFSFFFWNHYSY